MNNAQLDDFKQYLDSRLSQTETHLEQKIESEAGKLREEMQDGFAGIAEVFESHNVKLDDHETRITTLEAV